MKFHCITLFPEYLRQLVSEGVIGSAMASGRLELHTTNPREFTEDVHHTVDGKPFGGGDGMVMMAEPLQKSLDALRARGVRGPCYSLSPQGRLWNDRLAREIYAHHQDIILICGRYAGVDQRFVETSVDDEISVGDFVLSGGEIPAAIVMETLGRLVPGVLGNSVSSGQESFANSLLECPQMTRPREFQGLHVPDVLVSGDHLRVEKVRKAVSLIRTFGLRPDLVPEHAPLEDARKVLKGLPEQDLRCFGIEREWL